MKIYYIAIIVLFFILGGGPIGCSDTDEYEIVVYEDHPAYMISVKGDFFP